LYRPLRRLPRYGWKKLLIARTALVALFAAVTFAAAGYLMHDYAPEARSIGGVVRHWSRHR